MQMANNMSYAIENLSLNVKPNKKNLVKLFADSERYIIMSSSKVYTNPGTENKLKQAEPESYKFVCCDMCEGCILYFSALIP